MSLNVEMTSKKLSAIFNVCVNLVLENKSVNTKMISTLKIMMHMAQAHNYAYASFPDTKSLTSDFKIT